MEESPDVWTASTSIDFVNINSKEAHCSALIRAKLEKKGTLLDHLIY